MNRSSSTGHEVIVANGGTCRSTNIKCVRDPGLDRFNTTSNSEESTSAYLNSEFGGNAGTIWIDDVSVAETGLGLSLAAFGDARPDL